MVTQLPNATLHNETALLMIIKNYGIVSIGSFLLFFGITAANHYYVCSATRAWASYIYRKLTDFMAVVSLPLLLPEYLNDLLNMVPGYNSQAAPTIISSFVLAITVGLVFGFGQCVPQLRRIRCIPNMLDWFNVDMLNALSGAPYFCALIGTLAVLYAKR